MNNSYQHCPVLSDEVISSLSCLSNRCIVDATFGRGGHSRKILSVMTTSDRLFSFDCDPQARQEAECINDERFTFILSRFSLLQKGLESQGVYCISDLVIDLGVSSPQLDDPTRGFSFLRDGPLDMRMSNFGETAAEWLSYASVSDMTYVFKTYGEERRAKAIALRIDQERKREPLTTTKQLVNVVTQINQFTEKGKHPATRVFQAIRIHINRELEELSLILEQAHDLLLPGGRMIVISFHSLEDRIVKNFMKNKSSPSVLRKLPIQDKDMPTGTLRIIGRHTPGDSEIAMNNRSRSATLRVAEKQSLGGVCV